MRALRSRHATVSENGQMVPLYALVILVAGAAMLLLVHLGRLAVDRAHARTAADAAALAGAAEGRAAAEEVASANGATLDAFAQQGDDVEVVVSFHTAHAQARARRGGACGSAVTAHPVDSESCPPTNPG